MTLIELLVTLSVAAILITQAMPAFSDLVSRYRLKSAAETLYAHLQLAKAEAIKRNKNLRVSFTQSSGSWCYGLKENAACDCTVPGSCTLDGITQTASSSDFSGVSMTTHISSPGDHFAFDNVRGIMDSTFGNVRFTAGGKQVRVIVNRLGRIRFCSPAGDMYVQGYSTSC